MVGSIFLVLLSIAIFIFSPSHMDKLYIGSISLLMLFVIFVHILNKKEKNYLSFDVLFLFGFFIVHFQWPLQYSCGIDPANPNRIWVNEAVVATGTALSLLGGSFWMLGFYFPHFNSKKKYIISRVYHKISNTYLNLKINSSLTNISILLFVGFLFIVGSEFLSGIYLGTANWGSGATYLYILFSITIILAITAEIYSKIHLYNGSMFKWMLILDRKLLVLIIVYLFMFLLIGDRGGPLNTISAILVLISSTIRPVKLREMLLLIFFGAVIMSIIGLTRTGEVGDKRTLIVRLGQSLELTEKYEWYQPTQELANSNRTLYQALDNVPEVHDYFYGKLFLSYFLSVFPFGQNIYLSLTGDKETEIGSANYITYLVFGKNATSGEGTSLIADIYLNFGIFGVAIFMFFLGKLYSGITKALKNEVNYASLLMLAIIGSLALFQGRGAYFVWLRPLVWGMIIFHIVSSLQKNKQIKIKRFNV